jgi:dipicolinate synthase subunit B
MSKIKAGFALCGSFCTFSQVIPQMRKLADSDIDIYPIMSETAYSTDTRFGKAEKFRSEIEEICGKSIIHTLTAAEPIGPKKILDVLVIAPCTGNTIGKIANGITDTCVTLAAKAHLRNQRPLVIAVSTNDALSASGKNIGLLMNAKNVYFVPMRQDDAVGKPTSLVAYFDRIKDSVFSALYSTQIQPIFD